MLTSKKQEWILKMIKGPDLIPAGAYPGHYSSKSVVSITTENQSISISPDDVLDLSNSQFLYIKKNDQQVQVAWNSIVNLDFEEQEAITEAPHQKLATAHHRIFSLPLGKKVV